MCIYMYVYFLPLAPPSRKNLQKHLKNILSLYKHEKSTNPDRFRLTPTNNENIEFLQNRIDMPYTKEAIYSLPQALFSNEFYQILYKV